MGSRGGRLESSWGLSWWSWAVWGRPGRGLGGGLGRSWAAPGGVLGRLGAILGHLGAILGASWVGLGVILDPLGPSQGGLGLPLLPQRPRNSLAGSPLISFFRS